MLLPELQTFARSSATLKLTLLLRAAHVPLFLYPFLNTISKTRPFEYLRLTSLGVIGALVKVPAPAPMQRCCPEAAPPFIQPLHSCAHACIMLCCCSKVGNTAGGRSILA